MRDFFHDDMRGARATGAHCRNGSVYETDQTEFVHPAAGKMLFLRPKRADIL